MRTSDTVSDLTRFVGSWTLDPGQTLVTFSTKTMWIVPVKGTAKTLSGQGRISSVGQVTGALIIDANSFDTKHDKRDAHLRSGDFFDAVNHPTIVFHVRDGRPTESSGIELTGILEVRGIMQPLTLQADISESEDSAVLSTEVEVDRSHWGISWGRKMGVRLKCKITVRAHFVRTM